MDFLRGKHRIGLYLLLLAMLAVGALAAVWSVAGTGAYLTGEADWQSLAGDYRIGTIDYTVRINDELLLGRSASGDVLTKYRLAAPLLGGVMMFDPDPNLTDPTVRAREFNEGATLMRVRVANYSKNMVDVTAQFKLNDQRTQAQLDEDVPAIQALALPLTLNETTAATFDSRKYILDTLNNPTSLAVLNTSYAAHLAKTEGQLVLEMGLLPGSVTGSKPEGNVVQDGNTWCYYRDVLLVVWTEYGTGDHNSAVGGGSGNGRQGRFDATFTVGQLD